MKLIRQVVQATPADHPNFLQFLGNLGNVIGSQYQRTRRIEDLDEIILVSRRLVQATPPDHRSFAKWLSSLGAELHSRYERTRQPADIEDARVSRQAVQAVQAAQATGYTYEDRASCLTTLGMVLGCRYDDMGMQEDLEEAIEISRQTV
jgi:hypothetical protein